MTSGIFGTLFGRNKDTNESRKVKQPSPLDSAPDLFDERQVSLRCAEAREEERRRMAADLHDGPIQQLVNLVLRLDLAEKAQPSEAEQTRQELAALRQFSKDVLQEMRRFIFELRPSSRDDFSLLTVLRQYLQDFRTQYGIPAELHFDDANWNLENEISVNLFRIIQESLTNVRKHAQATQASVNLSRTASTVQVEIIDNGKGFDYTLTRARVQQQRKFGLTSMEDRAHALGCPLVVSSSPQGTRVSLTLSLDQNNVNTPHGSDSRPHSR